MKNIFYVLMLVISCKYGSDSYTATSNDNGITIDTLSLRCDDGGDGWWKAARYKKLHTGIDFECVEGEALKAWGDGKFLRQGLDKNGYGYWLETSQILNGVSQIILHAHLKEPIKNVSDIKRGDVIAICGRSGNVGEHIKTHVHLEVGAEGYQRNPVPILESAGIKVEKGSCNRL